MKTNNSKFLVNLFQGVTQKEIFFLVWFGIVAVSIMSMIAHYRKYTRRNFRAPGERSGPKVKVDARRLADPSEGKGVTVKGNASVQKKS